jgi:hypothetical protein
MAWINRSIKELQFVENMEYPALLSLQSLESQHTEYKAKAKLYDRLDDLVNGGYQIECKKTEYLQARPGEDPALYAVRVKRFTYTNHLGSAIGQQTSKLASGTVSIEGASDPFWARFRAGTDRKKTRSEFEFLSELFRSIQVFGSVFSLIDKPKSPVQIKTKKQEESLGLDPYVCIYSPVFITNWGEKDDNLEWVKIRTISQESCRFGEPRTTIEWKFIDAEQIATYRAYVRVDGSGQISGVIDSKGQNVEGDKVYIVDEPIFHGFGRLPIVRSILPLDMWAANNAYLLAMQHLDLENSRYDAGVMSYIQRTFKPEVRPDSDFDQTYADDESPIKTGNAYILRGDRFDFNESSGSVVGTLGLYLEEIRHNIFALFGLEAAASHKGARDASGISKKMDFALQEVLLRAYGSFLVDQYQSILGLVSIAAGQSVVPQVSGLDSFDIESLEGAMEIAKLIPGSLEKLLPPTAIKLFVKQLAGLLIKRVSADQQAQIDREVESMFGQMQKQENASEQIEPG